MDPKIAVTFDGTPSMAFVQGEDRTFGLLCIDQTAGLPMNLTGGSVAVSLPRAGGGAVHRSSAALPISSSQVSFAQSPSLFTSPDHGLVTGDTVQFSATGPNVLPTGLAAATNYLVVVVDNDNFTLTNTSGAGVNVTTSGTGTFGMTNLVDVVISGPTIGSAMINLRAPVTAAVEDGLAQALQVNLLLAGKSRVVVTDHGLDVEAQPFP